METHLTEDRYRRLLAGTLAPEEARALARHLEGACEPCEAFLASRSADALDGEVDRALAGAAPAQAAAAGNDLEFRRIQRAVAAGPPRSGARGGWMVPAFRVAFAAAAIVAVVSGLWAMELLDRTRHPDWSGEKGLASRAAPVRLRFLVDRGESLEKGISGQQVPAAARLRFEVSVARDADVALVRVGGGSRPEVLYHQPLHAGRTLVSVEGKPAAYPLAGLAGPQRFVVLASPDALDDARAAAAAAVLAPPAQVSAESDRLEGLTIDVAEVDVRE